MIKHHLKFDQTPFKFWSNTIWDLVKHDLLFWNVVKFKPNAKHCLFGYRLRSAKSSLVEQYSSHCQLPFGVVVCFWLPRHQLIDVRSTTTWAFANCQNSTCHLFNCHLSSGQIAFKQSLLQPSGWSFCIIQWIIDKC